MPYDEEYKNNLRIQGVEAIEKLLMLEQGTPPEMVEGIKLALLMCKAMKGIIRSNGWSDFSVGNKREMTAKDIISFISMGEKNDSLCDYSSDKLDSLTSNASPPKITEVLSEIVSLYENDPGFSARMGCDLANKCRAALLADKK